MADKQGIYFELSEALAEKLEKRIEELDVSKREYFEQYVRDDTEHITLDDPRAELEEIEHQLQDAQDELEEIRGQEQNVRNTIKTLEQKREELEGRMDEDGLITATSYDAAVELLTDRAVEDGITENASNVERVAEDWGRDPRAVCRDVYERSPRVLGGDVTVAGPGFGSSKVPSEWEKEWPAYAEAIESITTRVLDKGVLTYLNREVEMVADEYDAEKTTVVDDVRDAVGDDVTVTILEAGKKVSDVDAPEADLVIDRHTADKIGLDEST